MTIFLDTRKNIGYVALSKIYHELRIIRVGMRISFKRPLAKGSNTAAILGSQLKRFFASLVIRLLNLIFCDESFPKLPLL